RAGAALLDDDLLLARPRRQHHPAPLTWVRPAVAGGRPETIIPHRAFPNPTPPSPLTTCCAFDNTPRLCSRCRHTSLATSRPRFRGEEAQPRSKGQTMTPKVAHGQAEIGQRSATPGFKRVLTGSMIGAVLEWYDFAVYGVLAATVLGPLFFPGDDGFTKLLLALATQGIGFVARPLGGIVFGHLGDRFGRKPMLVVTFLLIGGATTAIGLLPTYHDIGIAATFLLVILRLLQGFGLGGEFGAAVLLVSEYGEPRRRGFWASWPQAGAPAGTVL